MSNEFNTNISADAKFYRLKPGAPKPTTATEALAAGTEEYGYSAVEGWNWAQSQTVEPIKAHQGKKTLRNKITDETKSVAATFLEDKKLVRETYHNGEEDALGRMVMKSGRVQQGTYVVDSTDDGVGYEKDVRFIFDATVSANGDLTFSPDAETTYPVMFNIIGEPVRITETRYSTGTPVDPTDPVNPPVDPPVGTFPNVTGLTSSYDSASEQLTVSWDAVVVTGGAAVSQYDIQLQPISEGASGAADMVGGNTTSSTLNGVLAGMTYSLAVGYVLNGEYATRGTASVTVNT